MHTRHQPAEQPRARRTRRRLLGAVALAALAATATACPTPPPVDPGPTFPCSPVSSVEVDTPIALTGVQPPGLPPGFALTFPLPKAMAEATSADGVVHVWVVAERIMIGLGSDAVVKLHFYATDTTAAEAPVEVFRAYALDNLFTAGLYQGHVGHPVSVNLDGIDPSGGGATFSVTYGQRQGFLTEGDVVMAPYRSFTHEIAC